MATMKAKLQGIKNGDPITVKKGKTSSLIAFDPDLVEAIRDFHKISEQKEALKSPAEKAKKTIADKAKPHLGEAGTLTFEIKENAEEVLRSKVTFGYTCVIPKENIPEVRKILGKRFDDLVRTKNTFEGNQTFIDECTTEKGAALKDLAELKEKSPVVEVKKFRPKKKAPKK